MPPIEQTNIKVVVRVRPYNRRELEQNQRSIIKILDQSTLLFDPDVDYDEFFFQGNKQNFRDITKRVHKKLSMEFDRVYDTETNNKQIFEECTSPLVDSVLDGYNCSVFVYGATGAGKTFTMLGNDKCAGLTYLTMSDLFKKIEAQSEIRKFNVAVSYLEVYNEQVMNLITKTGPLKLHEDSAGVSVSGLTPKPIFSADELLELLKIGNENRTQHPTDANAESSRSHAVFQVHIRITDRKTDIKRTVKLSMIDLAGSERAASTKGIGLRFREGANINKSLLALGNCINKLADGLKHIPYRDSNLTRILKDSLGGNCQTLMVANVSMSSLTFEDTYNTLKYASRAKKIRTTLRQNAIKTDMPKDFYIKKLDELMTENNRLKESQKALEAKLESLQNSATMKPNASNNSEIELKNWYWKIDLCYANAVEIHQYVLQLQSKRISYCFKLKEYSERYRNMLSPNQQLSKEDVEKITTAISRIGNEIDTITEEQSLWNYKLKDANDEMEKLNKNIKDSPYFDVLHIYQKYKGHELYSLKQNIKMHYENDVNSDVVVELNKLQQTFILFGDILQKSFDEFGIKSNMKHSLSKLIHILQLNMNPEQNNALDEYKENVKLLQNRKRIHQKNIENDVTEPSINTKMIKKHDLTNFETDTGAASRFKMPMPKKICNSNLNETQVLVPSTSSSSDFNTTFEIDIGTLSENENQTISKKKAFVNNILSENMVRLPQNKKFVESGLLKSKPFGPRDILKTVALGIHKENKKNSPNRIRRSPRSNNVIKTMTSTIKSKHPVLSNGAVPIVRTNRAASFRSKK